MTDRNQTRDDADHLTALSAVLKAEKETVEQVQQAYEQAARSRDEARVLARGIAARADRRVQTLHAGMQQKIEAEKAALEAAFEQEKARAPAGDPQALNKAAAQRLAQRLVGIGPKT